MQQTISQIKIQKKTNDMSKKINQITIQFGLNNNSTTTANLPVPEGYTPDEKEEYKKRLEEHKENLENAVKRKELELQVAHNDEKIELYKQIDGLKNQLLNLLKSFQDAQTRIADLEAIVEDANDEVLAKKLEAAINAIKKADFEKARKLLAEIEKNKKLHTDILGSIAYARGIIAEQEVRWKDAAECFARSAQFYPCFPTLSMAGKFAHATGNYHSALSFSIDSQKITLEKHGEKSRQYGTAMNNLGAAYNAQGNSKKAEEFFDKALIIRKNVMGKTHGDTGQTLNNLGTLYQENKEYNKAKLFLKQALKIYQDREGKNHPNTAGILNNLGAIYDDLKLYKKAEDMHKKALKIRQKSLIKNHPDIAESLNNLGLNYCTQGKYKKGAPLIEQALGVIQINFGPYHPHTKTVKENYEALKKYLPNT